VQARVASVVFGNGVSAITYPDGKAPAQVQEFSAHGGTEEFRAGFLALDGALNLMRGKGARLLIVASDNHLVRSQDANFRTAVLPELLAAGVGVLWINWGDEVWDQGIPNGVETVVMPYRGKPEDAAVIIGNAAKRAIEMAR
jgi:hypothetical protein